jgi:DMSO/TMAO reductase YedYZ molybdopterin-dependent catalytic subunit
MEKMDATRRSFLKSGAAALAGMTVLRVAGPSQTLGQPGEQVIPWLDQPAANPVPNIVGNILDWEQLDSWQTPASNFFFVSHYGQPEGLDESAWRVDIAGMVAHPRSLTIAEIKARARHEVDFTLECSGNNGLDFFIGGVGNARWAGTRLAPLLEQAGIQDGAAEVIFWGVDSGPVTVRDNSGVLSAGDTGMGEPDMGGGLDLTVTEQFARSMSVADAMSRDNLLCYEMNDEPLPPEHGFPVRLIAPGWYGVANVKWLTRIEVVDQRWAGRFMARDYVTIREQRRDGETIWTFATVGHDRLKSAPAKVTRWDGGYAIYGAAWGAPVTRVEVQIDDGPWMEASLDALAAWGKKPATPPSSNFGRPHGDREPHGYSWRFWSFAWGEPAAGEHSIRSRAFDIEGNIQPAPDDPFLTSKRTYWESNGQITRRVMIS